MRTAVLELAILAVAVATETLQPGPPSETTLALLDSVPATADPRRFVALSEDNSDAALFLALVITYRRQAERHGFAVLQRLGLEMARQAYGIEP